MKLAVRKTSTAIAAVATAGVSSLFLGAAPASAAPADACAGADLIAPGVCELTLTSGDASFTPTATMTKLEVLLVGAGGAGANQQEANTNGYAAAGGGGEVTVVDFSGSTSTIDMTVASAGVPGTATDGTTSGTADNGLAAADFGETGGASGNGNPGATGISLSDAHFGAGGGAGASPDGNSNGGDGVVVSSLVADDSLFADDMTCYGGGGAIGTPTVQGVAVCGGGAPADATGLTLTPPVANSGGGGGGLTIVQTPEQLAGADGVIVVRWNGATAALAFDASGHGVAPATQTVVAGTAGVKPADPTASGYQFNGWFTDAALTTPADFAALLTGDVTYYASWTKVLPATGEAPNAAVLPIGVLALLAGAGLVAVSRRKRDAS